MLRTEEGMDGSSDGRSGYKLSVKTGYELWLEQEGLPVVGGFGLEEVAEVARAPWARLGGAGAYVKFNGMEGYTGMYVAEIPGAGALNPEKHLYEEVIYVLRGRGSAEVWRDQQHKLSFEWGEGSLFAIPVNAWHRLFNGSSKPAVFMAVTNAPMVFDIFYNPDFVFNCGHDFSDRFGGEDDYYSGEGKRYPLGKHNLWETNFIPDVRGAWLDAARSGKIAGGHISASYELAGNTLIGHINETPVGKYHKAHYHGGGAILQILSSKGYTLMWPRELGPRLYQARREEAVVRVDWKTGGAFCPPSGWFHAHYNTGHEPNRQLAFHYYGKLHPVECAEVGRGEAVLTSVRAGGTLIDPEDEDPEIRRHWEAELRGEGIQSQMPAVVYRA